MKRIIMISIVTAVATIFAGCEPKPQPIVLGSDQCAYCRMMITELEFASQALNQQGRSFKFDSVECMAAFDLNSEIPEEIHSLWVPDFHNRESWLQSTEAVYLKSELLRSPMGLGLSAYATETAALDMQAEYGGEIISYEGVKEFVSDEWLSNGNNHNHH